MPSSNPLYGPRIDGTPQSHMTTNPTTSLYGPRIDGIPQSGQIGVGTNELALLKDKLSALEYDMMRLRLQSIESSLSTSGRTIPGTHQLYSHLPAMPPHPVPFGYPVHHTPMQLLHPAQPQDTPGHQPWFLPYAHSQFPSMSDPVFRQMPLQGTPLILPPAIVNGDYTRGPQAYGNTVPVSGHRQVNSNRRNKEQDQHPHRHETPTYNSGRQLSNGNLNRCQSRTEIMTTAPSSANAIPVGLQNGKQHPSPSTHKAPCEVDTYAPQDIICLHDSPGSGTHGEDDRCVKEQTSNIPTVERDSTTPGHLAPVPHLQQVSGERNMNPHCSVSHIDTHPNKSSDPQPDVTESRNSTQSFLCMGRASHQTCIVKKNF